MNALRFRTALTLVLALSTGGCATIHSILPFTGEEDTPKVNLADEPPDLLYTNGIDALEKRNYSIAVKHFDAIQQNYPYSSWATNAQLMDGYTEYRRSSYTEAVSQLDRYIALHPASKDVSYAYYLRALCYYEQIADISRDQKGTQEAMAALQEVVNRFPDSAYGRDARLKIDLCRDHLAGKEMLIGRYYEPHRGSLVAPDGNLSEARHDGRGKENGRSPRLQLSRQPLVSDELQRARHRQRRAALERSRRADPGPSWFLLPHARLDLLT
jgi:outer membrane assembly lipoprotein YfiO